METINYCICSNNKKWNQIMNDFKDEITLCFTDQKTPFCIYEIKNIYFQYEVYKNPTERDLFDLLHEIGHIQTNNIKMKRCEEEYYATQWALDHVNKYRIEVTNELIDDFQKYIWMWRDGAIKRKAKCVPSKQQLTLKYKRGRA